MSNENVASTMFDRFLNDHNVQEKLRDRISGLLNRRKPEFSSKKLQIDDYYIDDERFVYERSPNDQRSDVMNPNNPEYQAALDNRAN